MVDPSRCASRSRRSLLRQHDAALLLVRWLPSERAAPFDACGAPPAARIRRDHHRARAVARRLRSARCTPLRHGLLLAAVRTVTAAVDLDGAVRIGLARCACRLGCNGRISSHRRVHAGARQVRRVEANHDTRIFLAAGGDAQDKQQHRGGSHASIYRQSGRVANRGACCVVAMSGTDDPRICARCGSNFVNTAGEQRFYASRGLPDAPRRCAPCRKVRKAEQRSVSPPTFPRRVSEAVPTCSWCGQPARVPFEVAAHRPVACEPCYRWRLGASSGLRMTEST